MQVETAPSTTAALASTTCDVPLDTRVKERASGLLPVAPTLLRLPLVARAQVSGTRGSVRIAAFATMFHRGWITRPDRRDLSAVRSSLLPDEPAPAIFMAMQGPRLVRPSIRFMGIAPAPRRDSAASISRANPSAAGMR